MSSTESTADGIDDYHEFVWQKLGHPAFDDELQLNNKAPDRGDSKDELRRISEESP